VDEGDPDDGHGSAPSSLDADGREVTS
jgi:hypothetical protein